MPPSRLTLASQSKWLSNILVSKLFEKAVCKRVFLTIWHCIFFWRFCPLGASPKELISFFLITYRSHPSVVIQSILQCYFSKVSFFIGTIYKHHDCERVKMTEADAVIILCDKKCTNPDAEDAGNITRLVLMSFLLPSSLVQVNVNEI